jgi:hypothetical protein
MLACSGEIHAAARNSEMLGVRGCGAGDFLALVTEILLAFGAPPAAPAETVTGLEW